MKGTFEYISANYRLCKCDNSTLIPPDALEMVLFKVEGRPEPHTQADHEADALIGVEFQRIKQMIYGRR